MLKQMENAISMGILTETPYMLTWRALLDASDWIKAFTCGFCLVACGTFFCKMMVPYIIDSGTFDEFVKFS